MFETKSALEIDFEAAFNGMPGCYLLISPNLPLFTVLAISDELLENTGREREDIVGKSVFDAYPDNPEINSATGPSSLMVSLQHVVHHKTPDQMPIVRYDVPNAHGGFDERYWSSSSKPVLDKNGDLLYIIHASHEVTDQIVAKKRSSNKKINKTYELLMQAPVGITILSGPENIVELANEQILKNWSRTADIIGKPYFEVVPEAKSQGFAEILDEVRKTGETFSATEFPTMFLAEGQEKLRYYNVVCQPYFEAATSKYPTGVFYVAHDVTEQVLARKKVEESELRLQAIIETTPESIKIVSEDGTLLFMNTYGLAMIEGDDELLGNASILDIIAPEHRSVWKENLRRVCQGERLSWEFDIIGLKGTRRCMETHAVMLPGSNGTAQLAVTRDVTARKKQEEELKSKNDQLTQINNDLDNFIYTASHDLKSPISNIEGLLELLYLELSGERTDHTEVQQIMELMKSSVERFKKTITNLTDVVKLQQESDLATTLVSLPEMVQEVRLDLEPMLKEAGGLLELEVASCHNIRFAEKNLRSVIQNLLSNAIKYRSPDRVLQVKVACYLTPEYHVLSVTDNGLGISERNQEYLFTMFRRFHDHVEGTGIGLYMIKKMVENAGGHLQVESCLGKGSTFSVWFKR
ncbi:PAS domain-containing protein [Pontibacter sp. JH31]|uniref:histidine kinase n=1 Tax=Pontibacter aquaedesilientis TaxID=2766980 RepID=A0ABR7XDI6_9BACT|nr:PAS domain-containing protein [Pontibacter aquaedesilientis]MBD1396345.1 PAS domain-containing protein [Pontibacter aquaedesilientis]